MVWLDKGGGLLNSSALLCGNGCAFYPILNCDSATVYLLDKCDTKPVEI